MTYHVRIQINVISSYIGFDVSTESSPEVFSSYQLSSFFDYKLSCQQIIIVTTNDFGPNYCQDVQEALILEYTLNIFLAFQQVPTSQVLGLQITFLQLRQSQPHYSNTRNVRHFKNQFFSKRTPKLLHLRHDQYIID